MNETDRARAIRLGYLTQSPGWPDLVKMLNDLVNEQVSACMAFEGWDKDQKCDLMTRQQTAMQFRDELLKRIQNFLLAPDMPQGDNPIQAQTLADAVNQSGETDTRIPGTYERLI